MHRGIFFLLRSVPPQAKKPLASFIVRRPWELLVNRPTWSQPCCSCLASFYSLLPSFLPLLLTSPPPPSHLRSWHRLGGGRGSPHASLAERRTPRVSPGRTTKGCVQGRGDTLKIIASSEPPAGEGGGGLVANGHIQPRPAVFYSTLAAWRC